MAIKKKPAPTIQMIRSATVGGKKWTPEVAKAVFVLLESWTWTKVEFGRAIGIGTDGRQVTKRLNSRLEHWGKVLGWKKNGAPRRCASSPRPNARGQKKPVGVPSLTPLLLEKEERAEKLYTFEDVRDILVTVDRMAGQVGEGKVKAALTGAREKLLVALVGLHELLDLALGHARDADTALKKVTNGAAADHSAPN